MNHRIWVCVEMGINVEKFKMSMDYQAAAWPVSPRGLTKYEGDMIEPSLPLPLSVYYICYF